MSDQRAGLGLEAFVAPKANLSVGVALCQLTQYGDDWRNVTARPPAGG